MWFIPKDSYTTPYPGGFVSVGRVVAWLLLFALVGVGLVLIPQAIHGQTQDWSPPSDRPLRNSDVHLATWDTLSVQFNQTLLMHEATLKELQNKLETSETSLQQSTSLLERLSTQNDALKIYNDQIGERMQARDEALAQAYEELDKKDHAFRVLFVIVVCLTIASLVMAAIHLWNFLRWLR